MQQSQEEIDPELGSLLRALEEPEGRRNVNVRRMGVPTLREAESLLSESGFDRIWKGDEKQYCINLVAVSAGLGLGEIQALQRKSVHFCGDPFVEVQFRWNRGLGLAKRCPLRNVRIPVGTAKWLARVMAVAPDPSPDSLVFQGDSERRLRRGLGAPTGPTPVTHSWIGRRLREAFWGIGVDASERGISFDSWRLLSPAWKKFRSVASKRSSS